MLDKARVLQALRDAVQVDLDALSRMVAASRDEATSAESKAENKYDTRATEASYLAAGQGVRLAELRRLAHWLAHLDPSPRAAVVEGALCQLEVDGRPRTVLLAPQGGRTVEVDGVRVGLLSLASPLGEVLLELEPGDQEEVETPRGLAEARVIEVA